MPVQCHELTGTGTSDMGLATGRLHTVNCVRVSESLVHHWGLGDLTSKCSIQLNHFTLLIIGVIAPLSLPAASTALGAGDAWQPVHLAASLRKVCSLASCEAVDSMVHSGAVEHATGKPARDETRCLAPRLFAG
jgi:hypothetical protein